MALIEWNDTYSVGHAIIDRQHKILVKIVNQLNEALVDNNTEQLSEFFEELLEYTIIHFDTEEKLMDKYDFNLNDEHKKEHKDLTDQVLSLQKQVNSGEKKIDHEVLDFLQDWLLHHIMETDQKLGKFLEGRN